MQRKRILIVDDSKSMRCYIRFILKSAGYDITEAVDGYDAIQKLNGTNYNLFIFDLIMPCIDGISLIKRTRTIEKYRFTPIIVVTTESRQCVKIECRQAGATAWIVKPFKSEQLLALTKKILG
ncbi:MAG: response regulator [Candidatus Magnetoovum sp. WYHC-5]|nr:response regulator [Candidatus Magnetoovum sp. WYHC-5]